MTLLFLLSYLSFALQIVFATVSIAAGFYYLAELVEEFSVIAKKVILILIGFTTIIYILLLVFDNITWTMGLCGLVAQCFHKVIMKNFPFISFLSVPFCGTVLISILNHFLAFRYFSSVYHPLSEVLAYFVLCLWLVPCGLFISLSANDNVLPMSDDHVSHHGYKEKQGLLSFLSFMKPFTERKRKNMY